MQGTRSSSPMRAVGWRASLSIAAGREGLPVQPGGNTAADVPEVFPVQHPILTGHDGGVGDDEYTGEHLMGEVFDLMRRRLPQLHRADPYRPRLMALLPQMGAALGRDRLVPVQVDPARQHRAGP